MYENNMAKFEFPNLGSIFKFVDKGRVDKAYKRMWEVASEIAHAESLQYWDSLDPIDVPASVQFEKVCEYERQRRDYHLSLGLPLINAYITNKS